MSTSSKIKIIDNGTKEVLYEYSFDDSDKAYAMATQMEEMGLDISIVTPSVTETLCDTLGLENDAKEDYEQSVIAEMHDHEGSCCIVKPDKLH